MINNSKVYLRALEPSDYETTIRWRRDSGIWEMLAGRKYFVSESFERDWLEKASKSSSDIKLAICDVQTNLHIGNIYLSNIDFFNKSASTAKLIGNKEYWGKGYGTEATLLILYHAFYDLGLERVESRILSTNKASIRVQEKCGYQIEGVLRKAAFKAGELQDVVIMSILKDEFFEGINSRYKQLLEHSAKNHK